MREDRIWRKHFLIFKSPYVILKFNNYPFLLDTGFYLRYLSIKFTIINFILTDWLHRSSDFVGVTSFLLNSKLLTTKLLISKLLNSKLLNPKSRNPLLLYPNNWFAKWISLKVGNFWIVIKQSNNYFLKLLNNYYQLK